MSVRITFHMQAIHSFPWPTQSLARPTKDQEGHGLQVYANACYGCERLRRVMTESFGHIWEIAQQKKLPLRTAAFVKALQSVTRAHLHRGFD